MSLIRPRTRGKHMVRLVTRLDRDNQETLHAYAQFLCEPVEYVLNELIDTVLAKDKDFAKWRAEHPDSCVPTPTKRRGRQAPAASGRDGQQAGVRTAAQSSGEPLAGRS